MIDNFTHILKHFEETNNFDALCNEDVYNLFYRIQQTNCVGGFVGSKLSKEERGFLLLIYFIKKFDEIS